MFASKAPKPALACTAAGTARPERLRAQASTGNQANLRRCSPPRSPTPLARIAPDLALLGRDDPGERAADLAAAQVMAGAEASGIDGRASRRTGGRVPPGIDAVLAAPGEPLDAAARAFFEPRFGRDLSGVRVHHDIELVTNVDAFRLPAIRWMPVI